MDKDKIHPIDGRIYNPLQKSPGKKYGAVNRLVPKRSRMMKKSASDGRFLNPAGKIELAGSKSVVALEEKKDVVEETPQETVKVGWAEDTEENQTFTKALNLDARYLEEFKAGNFIYLQKKKGIDHTMYDLEVIEHFEIDPDCYYTMSLQGITSFSKNESIFCTLDKWETEFQRFKKIRMIPFFQRYRAWKNFVVWKTNIRSCRLEMASKRLNSTLFLLNKSLQGALIFIHQCCSEISRMQLIGFDATKIYQLVEFNAFQEAARLKSAEKLRGASEQMLKLAISACDSVVDSFLEANKIAADHKMTFMERAALRKECRNLASFLRVSDFVMNTAVVDLAVFSVEQFNTKLQIPENEDDTKDNIQPMFYINVNFEVENQSLIVAPMLEDFVFAIEDTIKESMAVIDTPERLLDHEALASFTSVCGDDENITAKSEEELNIASTLNDSTNFNSITNDLFTSVEAWYSKVDDYLEVFEPFQSVLTKSENDLANFQEKYKDASAEELTEAIEEFEKNVDLFSTIPELASVGIFKIDSKALKEKFTPCPRKCIESLKSLLPVIIHDHGTKLIEQLNFFNPKAMSTPSSPQEFVSKVQHMDTVVQTLPALKSKYVKVNGLYDLMDSRKWSVSDALKDNVVLIKEGISTLEGSSAAFEDQVDADTVKFVNDIAKEIPELNSEVTELSKTLDDPRIKSTKSPVPEVIEYLKQQEVEIVRVSSRATDLNEYQQALKQSKFEFEEINEVLEDLNIKLGLWVGLHEWDQMTEKYADSLLSSINTTELSKKIAQYHKTAYLADKHLGSNEVTTLFSEKINKFKLVLPIISDIRCQDLQGRHWQQINELFGFDMKEKAHDFTVGDLLNTQAMHFASSISKIAVEAQQEAVLENMLSKVLKLWDDVDLEVVPHKDCKDVFVLGSVEDIMADLDDSIVTTSTILGSRFVGPIQGPVDKCRQKLVHFQEVLEEWLAVQKNWMYLENIFASPDIQRQLPVASKTFMNVDTSWKHIMKRTFENPNALAAGNTTGLKQVFVQHNIDLDKIQKSLEDYLETKRMTFPRFYFLSNDELLEILSQQNNPQAVQPHLRKCFENLILLDFGSAPGSVDMLAMLSAEKERVPLGKNLKARGNVEDWLKTLELNMKLSIYKLMKAGLLDYDEKVRSAWVCEHPGQVVATAAQMTWARDTEKALLSESIPKTMQAWFETIVFELNELIIKIRGTLTDLERKVIVSLITTDVHARDIVERLCLESVDSPSNFIWQQQLRYYWDPELDDVITMHSDSCIRYGYEYMGATSRLVITPLTDRCWMTLTGAFGLKLGAAPAGPAGTGKTESSKDLAKALAIQCVVFNCSDQIDYKMMGKLFRGLAQAGNWTCLDEFNRIDIEVLSVVAQQLLALREGRLSGKADINFMGIQIPLKDHHVIVTMNPGYAGRTELPDNLKICFRPVSMMVPDYALIAEIMLFAEGFSGAKSLSRKMCKLYILCSEQLSQQPHYDYGLRAVKSVLVMAGALKRSNPDLPEDVSLIRALRDSNIPKFLSDDLPLFHAIVSDLFPNIIIPPNDLGEIERAIVQETEHSGLQNIIPFKVKIIQLFETFKVRFGTTLVGPTGAGKSTCYRILQASMTKLRENGSKNPVFQKIKTNVLNPKCITMGEMYGEFNQATQEWHDGLASTIMRAAVGDESPDNNWTVFDGPIDALWIENMNTVLDDNMTLCLANGERIKLRPEMRMLFEVMDLAVASPATVSRIGVVYMTPEDLGWMPYVTTWLCTLEKVVGAKKELLARVKTNFEVFDAGLAFLRKSCTEPVKTVDINIATSFCKLFECLLKEAIQDNPNHDIETLLTTLDQLFAFSFIWSIGGAIGGDSRDAFDVFCRNLLESEPLKIRLPPSGMLYDYFVDSKNSKFLPWKDIVPAFEYDKSLPYFQLLVPTPDSVRYAFLLKKLIKSSTPSYVSGVTGSGKTMVIQSMLNELSSDESAGSNYTTVVMNFSAQTSSLVTQNSIESKMEKKRKNLLGPPSGRSMVIFIDDINMPSVEEYGAQPPIELLRQFLDFKGFYDRNKLFWKEIADTQLMVAAAPAGGGRSDCTPRFVRHFHVLCMQSAAGETLKLIFESILGAFLNDFNTQLQGLKSGIVSSIIEIYERVSLELLPTPSKFHYTFNLRDISKVFQGILMISPAKCSEPDTMHNLWIHEALRVFCDRLNTSDDQAWFQELTCSLLKKNFGKDWECTKLFESKCPLVFCDFLKPGAPIRTYEHCNDFSKIVKLFDDYAAEYNLESSNHLNLVFFRDAVRHICRLTRIFRQPRGSAMLIGVGGSGKQSITRLAAFIESCTCFRIEITRGYGLPEFREDIKNFMRSTGVEGESCVFLFTDSQIVEESFLEDINNVLNSGEVPNLFQQDEIDKIVGDMRPVLQELGIPETRDNCLATFTSRVRDNLHIVLCMSPVGSALRIRCRAFPALINCCTIDWYMNWPKEALFSVAERLLSGVVLPTEEVRVSLVEMCTIVHTSSKELSVDFLAKLERHVYTTPKSYLDLITLYVSMLKEKRNELQQVKDRMKIGVQKLEETNEIVDDLKADLIKLQPVLKEKAVEAEKMLKQVAIDQASAAKVKARVSKDEARVGEQAAEVAIIQAEAQKDLDVALPALNNSIKALDSLSKSDITEVKSFKKPPEAVRIVMEAVCILMGSKTDWDAAKKLLGDLNFIEKLKTFDKDNISPAILKKLSKYIADPVMAVEAVKKVSKAATSLCMWVHAMDVYSSVAKDVAPKQEKLEALNEKLSDANAVLQKKQSELKTVNDRVMELEQNCTATVNEKNRLQAEAKETEMRLVRAEKLITGLSSEGVRWKEKVCSLTDSIAFMVGDVFLSAACTSYYGAFTGSFRQLLVSKWLENVKELCIPCSPEYSLALTLGSPVQIREWQLNGLPTDEVSTDNAILVTRAQRWPLMIDPQGQAKSWIKNSESSLEVSRMTDANMLRVLESCIRVGKSLLIEDIDEKIEPSLEPILQRATFVQGGRTLIRLGDTDVDYDPNFKFCLTTKLANPHYLPEVCIKVTIINFTVTMAGLEDQLLGDVVKQEQKEMEEKKNTLVVSMAQDKKELKDIESKILTLLSESGGNVLDDEVLIEILASSKTTAIAIKGRVEEAEKTEREILVARERYRPVATRGSIMYFVVADLASIDPMYQYSLAFFQKLFCKCIVDCPKSDDMDTRISSLVTYQTYAIYANICRGLFEVHKTLFSSLISFKISLDDRGISPAEWNYFLRDPEATTPYTKNPGGKKLNDVQWAMLSAFEEQICIEMDDGTKQYPLDGICKQIAASWDIWEAWLDESTPNKTTMPKPFGGSLSDFQVILVLRCLADGKVQSAVLESVSNHLGKKFVDSPMVSMEDIYNDIDAKTPCIFVLSSGADPTAMLLRFAKDRGYSERLHVISLGQGQGPHAEALISKSQSTGDWILLQNCHLAKTWMSTLEKIVDSFGVESKSQSEDFRLYLTSFPAAYFPVTVLQNGVKLTNEPPKGIRANIVRSFGTIVTQQVIDDISEADTFFDGTAKKFVWKKLLVGLTFFHAIVQERRKFGALGWNIKYEFNDADLETSVSCLFKFLREQDAVPWDALRYVTGEINYGGRVTDDWDRRCLMSILGKFYTTSILDDEYKFSKSGKYFAPSSEISFERLYQYVSDLPNFDHPELFGMHENAHVIFEKKESKNLVESILGLEPRNAVIGGGKSNDQIVLDVASSIETNLPDLLNFEEAGPTTFTMRKLLDLEVMDSLATVLSQEIHKFNNLLKVLAASLSSLKKAINGLIVMSSELDSTYVALLNNKVPPSWEVVSFASLKGLSSWVKDLIFRLDFFRNWLRNGPPTVFMLSAFFFPQGFMTGTLQNFARKYSKAIDGLSFTFSVIGDVADAPPQDGVYISGLWLEGGKWNSTEKYLMDASPGEMYSPMQIIHFLPSDAAGKKDSTTYACPVYKTSARRGTLSTTGISTNFVVAVSLPTNVPPEYWVLNGTAFLLNLDV